MDKNQLLSNQETHIFKNQERYAIYFTLPCDDPLYQLATLWLGYDVCTGRTIEDVEKNIFHPDLKALAKFATTPKRYGFHATLKAPFRLHQNKTIEELKLALGEFSSQYPAFKCKPLKIKKTNDFLALKPIKPSKKLDKLASDCVRTFDEFRAPLNESEIAKRNPEYLTARQRELLDEWGYPFVMDEFHFHMTLSNKLNKEDSKIVKSCLKELFRSFLGKPFWVDHIYLFHQSDNQEPFKLIEQYSLDG